VTLRLTDVPLADALDSIGRQAGVRVAYGEDVLRSGRRVTARLDGADLATALRVVLGGSGLEPLVSSDGRLVIVRRAAALPEQPSGRVIGAVVDSATGQPVLAAQVSIAGASRGASTGDDGRYVIGGLPAGSYTVEVRRVGYRPARRAGVEVATGATATVDFQLTANALVLQQVVTTGVVDPTSGTRTPFTVGRVGAEQMPVPPTNAVEALAGRVAGASVVSPGQPGSGINLQLRTPASINKDNRPLYVVDGVILGQTVDQATADLNSLDIESIEVVKGAAAASLYGSRASNGVVQIRTRRGRELADGRTRVTVRSEYGVNSLQSPLELSRFNAYRVSAGQYVDSTGAVVPRSGRTLRPDSLRFQDQPYPGGVFDPIGDFFDAGRFSQNSITIARNQTATNFLLTLSNQGTAGVILDNGGYSRNDVRLNLDHRPRADLSLGVSGYYSRAKRDDLDNNLFFDLVQQAPDIDLAQRDSSGQYVFELDGLSRRPNPLYTLATQSRETNRTRALGSIEGRYTPASWLTLDANASYDHADRESDFFQDRGVRSATPAFDNVGGITRLQSQSTAFNGAASANLLGRFGGLTARGSLRALMEREQNDRFGARGSDLIVPGIRNLNGVHSRLPVSDGFLGGAPFSDSRTNSYIATAGAEYGSRYIVDALVRRDGSSLFGPEERWQTYYRGSAAWRVASESWWPLRQVSEFKPRLSRGTAGGRPDFRDQYETFRINDQGALERATLGNPFLKPELATETELGLDVIAFGRYSMQLSYARSTVEDQLLLVPLPVAVGGFSSQWQNAGTLTGNTVEGTFEARLLDRPKVGWTVGLVGDRTRNRITEFNRPCVSDGPSGSGLAISLRCAGVTLGNMYGQSFATSAAQLPAVHAGSADQFQVNDDGLLVPVGSTGSWRDGRWGKKVTIDGVTYDWGRPMVRVGADGNPLITRIGDANPKFRYGVSNSVRYGAFNFYALVDAQAGGNVYDATKQRMYQLYRSADEDQAGKPDAGKKPLEYYDRLYNGNNVSSWFVEPGGYVKLRELSVRYKVGQRLLRPLARTGARGVTLGLIGRNLLTFTDYSGYDPEVGSVNYRVDNFEYPRFRTVTGTVEIEF
jgi:TonB-linked SusC/RagA family outer membrane protein